MNSFDRFAQLWTDYLEGEISDLELIELRELIANNPEHLKAANDLYQLHRMLGLISREDSDAFVDATMGQIPAQSDDFVKQVLSRIDAHQAAAASVQVVSSRGRQWSWWSVATTAVGLAVILLIAVNFIFHRNTADKLLASPQVTFANTARTKFLGAFTPAMGSAVKLNNEYILTSGSVQLRFPAGAEAIVEGPAIFNVLSNERLQISVGQCSVYCPDGAEGFAVDTPSAHVVDRGTRFAVKVVESSSTEVHVIEGIADVFRPSSTESHISKETSARTPSGDRIRLTNNQARTFDHDSDFVPVPTDFQSHLYQSQLPDRILSYQATLEDGGVKDLTTVRVQRDGSVKAYSASELIGAKLIWFKIAEKIADMRHLSGPSSLPVNREDLLADFGLHTGAINPGGSQSPLTSDPVFPGSGVDGEDTTPGLAVQFTKPIVNRPGPDVLFFELQNVTGSPDGDAFHVSPLKFSGKRKTATIQSYDLTLTSPEVQRPTTFYLHDFDKAVDSFDELLNGQCRPLPKPQGWASYRVIAVAIDLSSMGFEADELVDGLFIQDCLDDPNHVDPVAIFGLP